MKKIVILLIIALACIFIASCAFDSVMYCPYCGVPNVTSKGDGTYKCENSRCGKTFGAKRL